jgi:hypothetical protein
MASCRGIGPDITAAQPAAVGEAVLDAPHSPSLVVQHQVVDDRTYGQLRVFLDGVVLEVFVAAIAVHEEPPIRVPLANALAQGQPHGRALHVQGLVVLDHAHRLGHVDVLGACRDCLKKKAQS